MLRILINIAFLLVIIQLISTYAISLYLYKNGKRKSIIWIYNYIGMILEYVDISKKNKDILVYGSGC